LNDSGLLLRGCTVRDATAADAEAWDAFALQQPQATFFHRAGWREAVESGLGHRTHYQLAERDGRIVGVLPLAQVKSLLFGNVLISGAFTVYGGPLAADAQAAAALDARAVELADRLNVDFLEYRSRAPGGRGWAVKDDLYYTFRREIGPDPEANLTAIPRKQRAVVRQALKHGLEARVEADVDLAWRLYAESVHRLGTPVIGRGYFRTLKRVFGDDCEALVVRHEGRPIASLLSFYFRDEVLPYYAGGVPEARRYGAHDFMYYDLMCRAGAAGRRVFDFGRSKRDTGPFAFKKNWGFTPEPLCYEFHLRKVQAIPENNPLNPKYRLFIAAWQKLPGWLANRAGPLVARQLG